MTLKYGIYFPVSGPNLDGKVRPVRNWLELEIGTEYEDWEYSWGLYNFYFKTEEDKVKFILRWL